MTQTGRHGDLSSSERGFVIVAVLWLVAALAALAVIFSAYLSSSARAIALNDSALETEALVSAGVELTAYQLRLAREDARPSQGSFRTRLNGSELAVTFVSEAARVDLNAAPKELLANLLTVLGAAKMTRGSLPIESSAGGPRQRRSVSATKMRYILRQVDPTRRARRRLRMSTNWVSCSACRRRWSNGRCHS